MGIFCETFIRIQIFVQLCWDFHGTILGVFLFLTLNIGNILILTKDLIIHNLNILDPSYVHVRCMVCGFISFSIYLYQKNEHADFSLKCGKLLLKDYSYFLPLMPCFI